MSESGKNNFKGINYQAWAAMLLFLVRINEGGFDLIRLEDNDWEDFTLVYRNGKKIVCEAKYRSKPLGLAEVRKILDNVLSRKAKILDGDEIIIVTPAIVEDLGGNLAYIQYFDPLKDKYRKLGFTDHQIELLAKTSFYLAESAESIYKQVVTYFYSLIPYWLPESEVERWLKSVLVDEVYIKSAEGESFTRTQLSDTVERYRQEKIRSEVDYDSQQRAIAHQVETILGSIEHNDPLTIKRSLTSLTAQPDRLFILLDKVSELKDINLEDWDFLWAALLDRHAAFRILFNFEKYHAQDSKSAAYILRLFTSHIVSITNISVDRFNAEMALGLVSKIVDLHPDLMPLALAFCKAFINERAGAYFDLDAGTANSHEKQLFGDIIYKLFSEFKKQSNSSAIQEVLKIVNEHFSLVEDDGNQQFFIYTPRPVFDLLSEFITMDFEKNFKKVKRLLVRQYKNAEFYGGKYAGWELMGGTTSRSGDDYSVDDRHFISFTLKPAIVRRYEADPEGTWKYLLQEWITTNKSRVSTARPDFLNRAAVDTLMTEYAKSNHAEEAFDILKAFVLMNKGIPQKCDIVFQALRDANGLSDLKKWRLVQEYLAKYKLPYSVFVEQVAIDLAIRGHKEALDAIKEWVNNKEYRERQNRRSSLLGNNLLKLLNASPQAEMYLTGVEILKAYISTADYKQNLSTYDVYDITGSIARILSNNPEEGIAMLWDVYRSGSNLTINQQITISDPLLKLDKENPELLLRVYNEFVKPLIFTTLEANIQLIEKKFSHNYAREIFVQYAEHLAEARQYRPALDLVKVFVNDTNPRIINEPNDKDGSFNYHQQIIDGKDNITISTVRGWCAWTLGRFAILYGRDYIEEAFSVLKPLANDPNYYVRVMAILAMVDFVRNRHTVLPGESKERFISRELAGKIEDLVFAILRDEDNQKYPVILRHLADAFGHMRSMSEAQALEVLNVYRHVSFESDINDIYPLFIFFALFRKSAFDSEYAKIVYGRDIHDELAKFDDAKFKALLDDLIRESTEDARSRIAWHFWKLPRDEGADYDEMFSISLQYLYKLIEPYSKHVIDDIFYFINENIDRKTNECIALWRACIKEEKEYLVAHQDTIKAGQWWANHYNGTVLTKIKEAYGDSDFLDSFELLLSYPEQFDIGIDISLGHHQLKVLADNGNLIALNLKKKLADRYPRLYDLERSQQPY